MKHLLHAMLFMAVILLAGCSQDGADSGEEEERPITLCYELFGSQTAEDTENEWYRELEHRTGEKITVQRIPSVNYVSRIERMTTADSLPMAVATNDSLMSSPVMRRAISAGSFWKLDDYIEDYPALYQQIGEQFWESVRIDGAVYGIPRLRIQPRNGLYYRADWAQRLGISEVRTLEDFYRMLTRFTYEDPDENGRDDTYGLGFCWTDYGNKSWNGIATLTTVLGGPNYWEYRDNAMLPDFFTEEYLEALRFFRRCINEGVMSREASITTVQQRQKDFLEGNTGCCFGCIDDALGLQAELESRIPGASLSVMTSLENGDKRRRVNSDRGYNGMLMFNKSGEGGIRTEEELRRVLSFFNSLCKQEDLFTYGVEQVDFVQNPDGSKELLKMEDGTLKLNADMMDFTQIFTFDCMTGASEDSELKRQMEKVMEESSPYLVFDDADLLQSSTYIKKKESLNRIIQNASMRYILGEIGDEEFNAAREEWLEAGGTEVISELTEQYELKKK